MRSHSSCLFHTGQSLLLDFGLCALTRPLLRKFVSWKFASQHTHVLKVYVMKVCKLKVCFTIHTHVLKVCVMKIFKLEVCDMQSSRFESLCYESL